MKKIIGWLALVALLVCTVACLMGCGEVYVDTADPSGHTRVGTSTGTSTGAQGTKSAEVRYEFGFGPAKRAKVN